MHAQLRRAERTPRCESQHRVAPVHMLIEEQVIGLQWARTAVTARDCFNAEARERVMHESLFMGLQLAPCNHAVSVGIEPERVLQVTQGNVPFPVECCSLARLTECQITVAWLVGLCRDDPDAQQDSPECLRREFHRLASGSQTLPRVLRASSVRSS